ncbi:hypothetical protein AVEN_122408-1, partial [Araneus ventricosus]
RGDNVLGDFLFCPSLSCSKRPEDNISFALGRIHDNSRPISTQPLKDHKVFWYRDMGWRLVVA